MSARRKPRRRRARRARARRVRRNPAPRQSIRFALGRPKGSRTDAIQAVMFSTREWSQAEARDWLRENGFKAAALDRDLGWWIARQREMSEFESQGRKLRAVDIGTRRERISVASNPKKRRQRRKKVKGGRRRRSRSAASSPAPRRRRRRPARRARARGKTTRTTVKSTKVVRTNARKKSRVRRRRRTRSARRFTLMFAPGAARLFARVARISKARKREMRRALRRHPSGGVFVNLAGWHGSRAAALRFAARVKALLGVAAARRRVTVAAPRVVAVP